MRFERISTCPEATLPKRATTGAAGYDFECAEDVVVKPHSIALIPTGIKCQIDDGYYLQLALRSSTPKKKGLMLANSVGIIDSDYYNNDQNEGHIMFQVYNFTDQEVLVPCGERIGQGMFIKYFKTDDDVAEGVRTGGFGSTDENMTSSQTAAVNEAAADAFWSSIFGSNPFKNLGKDISSEEECNTGDFQND